MSILGMSQTEYDYYVATLCEGASLIGQDAYLYQVDAKDEDLYQDPQCLYKPPIKIGIIFEDNPKPILKKNNWLTEDEELPYVAYIVPVDRFGKKIKVDDHMKVRVISNYSLESDRLFIINNVRANHIDPVVWICKMSPYRFKVDMKPETPEYDKSRDGDNLDTSFGYLNV